MHKEIGSEFWTRCTPTSNDVFTMRPSAYYLSNIYKVVETISGRTALEYIVEILCDKNQKRAYLPSYCCHTMIEPFINHGMEVLFYDVEISEEGIHRIIVKDDYDVILLLDYFGHIDIETKEIAKVSKQCGKTVIYDATHSLFYPLETEYYDYVYASYRKWVDINCGFVAWKNELYHGEITQNDNYQTYAAVRSRLFDLKAEYMNGGNVSKEDFLPLINTAESFLEEQYHHRMSDERSMDVLKTTDASYIINHRKTNARFLMKYINDIDDQRVRYLFPKVELTETALFVPVIVASEMRDLLRKHLINNEIYCPAHWPVSAIHKLMKGSKELFASELSLICDQRYDETDMQRIAECISDFLHK